MPKLPVISGKEAIVKLERIGYREARQKGSHVRLCHQNPKYKSITVSLHAEIKKGLLHAIIRDAGLSVAEFIKL